MLSAPLQLGMQLLGSLAEISLNNSRDVLDLRLD